MNYIKVDLEYKRTTSFHLWNTKVADMQRETISITIQFHWATGVVTLKVVPAVGVAGLGDRVPLFWF